MTALLLDNHAVYAQQCAGDCDDSGSVAVHELVGCVGIALERTEFGVCPACDADDDAFVSVGDLVTAVNASLQGCPAPTGAVARFELAQFDALDWGAVPFPSDLYRDGTGAIRIGALPVNNETALHGAMREVVQARGGFCATCNVYFLIDGDIDRDSLPSGSNPSSNDSVILIDADPASPERGRLFPLRVQWDAERRRLAARPVRGIALHRNRRYAAALTSSVRAADGSALRPTETFIEVRSLADFAPTGVDRARAVVAPALAELERVGISRDQVVALATFTTEDVPADVLAARAAVQDGAPFDVVIERRRSAAEIDELLGTPSEDRPGIDVPPAEGTAGNRSIAHGNLAEVITGYFNAPRVVSGAGKDIGTALRDENGRIVAGAREPVPFVLTLPSNPAGLPMPIVVAHHGFNASRVTGFATANTAASVGVAVLAIDAFQHGERAASARDEVYAIRGNLPGADGFAETEMLDLSARVFGLLGAAPGLELFPAYSLGAFLQFGADIASAVRIIRDDALAQALRAAGLTAFPGFDSQRIGYIGNSLGAAVGASVLVAEPDVRFAVQNVQPGSIVETLAESPEFRPLVEGLYFNAFNIQGTFDEVQRHLIFEPMVDLSRWILEPVEPLALAPYLLRDPVRTGGAAEILFQVAALDEVAAALATESMIDATGSTRVSRYDPAAHGMLEVLHQSSRFIPPAVPPFMLRPEILPVVNPIVEVHQEIEAFLLAETSLE